MNPHATLNIRETAHLSGATISQIEKSIESRIMNPVPSAETRQGATGHATALPIAAVAYFAALRDAEMVQFPVHHKRLAWTNLKRLPMPDLGPIEITPGLTLDPRRAGTPALRQAIAYKDACAAFIETRPDVLGGVPVLKGTRLSVYAIHGRLKDGDSIADLCTDYPEFPARAFEAADIFARSHPRRGRPTDKPWRRSPREDK